MTLLYNSLFLHSDFSHTNLPMSITNNAENNTATQLGVFISI